MGLYNCISEHQLLIGLKPMKRTILNYSSSPIHIINGHYYYYSAERNEVYRLPAYRVPVYNNNAKWENHGKWKMVSGFVDTPIGKYLNKIQYYRTLRSDAKVKVDQLLKDYSAFVKIDPEVQSLLDIHCKPRCGRVDGFVCCDCEGRYSTGAQMK